MTHFPHSHQSRTAGHQSRSCSIRRYIFLANPLKAWHFQFKPWISNITEAGCASARQMLSSPFSWIGNAQALEVGVDENRIPLEECANNDSEFEAIEIESLSLPPELLKNRFEVSFEPWQCRNRAQAISHGNGRHRWHLTLARRNLV